LAHPQSKFHGDKILLERIRLAAAFLECSQSREGNIDLLSTNFNSPPDTGVVVHNVATAAAIGQLYAIDELVRLLRPFLVKAGAGAPYYQPLPHRVTYRNWAALREARTKTQVCRLEQIATVFEWV
jgi:hypothetical protein